MLTEFDRILGRKTSGLFTDFNRILRRRLPDCLRIFTGLWGGGFRIVYGILPNLVEQAYGLFTDFDRIWGMRLTDCFRNFTEFGGGGLRIVYGFLADFGEEASGLFTDFYRIWRRRLTDLPNLEAEAYGFGGLRIWDWGSLGAETLKQQPPSIGGKSLANCLWIGTK